MDNRIHVNHAEGGVVYVTLDFPPINCLSQELVREMDAAFWQLGEDRSVRAVILHGSGPRAFCAGGYIRDFVSYAAEGKDPVAIAEFYQRAIDRVEALPCPVIAAIHGHCLGGGLELALACDIHIADETARLGLPEARLGLIPAGGGTQRLPRAVGIAIAKHMILTGEAIDAHEARRIGLVSQVVPAGEVLAAAESLARRIAAGAPLALAAAKRSIDGGKDLPLPEALALEAQGLAAAWHSEDRQEGVTAFLERREPRFQGR